MAEEDGGFGSSRNIDGIIRVTFGGPRNVISSTIGTVALPRLQKETQGDEMATALSP